MLLSHTVFNFITPFLYNTVHIAPNYGLDDWEARVWIMIKSRILPSLCYPDQLWHPPSSYIMGMGWFFPWGEVAGTWSWLLVPMSRKCGSNIYSPICLHGIVLSSLSTDNCTVYLFFFYYVFCIFKPLLSLPQPWNVANCSVLNCWEQKHLISLRNKIWGPYLVEGYLQSHTVIGSATCLWSSSFVE
jgi:hypothetical protein